MQIEIISDLVKLAESQDHVTLIIDPISDECELTELEANNLCNKLRIWINQKRRRDQFYAKNNGRGDGARSKSE